MNIKKSLFLAIFAIILLTSSFFTAVPENKSIKSASNETRFLENFHLWITKNQNNKPKEIHSDIKSVLFEEKLLSPQKNENIGMLFKALKGFGEKFASPPNVAGQNQEFLAQDREILENTKKLYGNPANFELGEQCGLQGESFSYPPENETSAACGGTPGFGGTACNTSPQCYFSGKCFWICTTAGCSCEVQSCYGKCGNGSAYIWDSITKSCGCGQ